MLELIIAPDPIYKTVCTPVTAVDDSVRATLDAMMETLEAHHAMGIGAPMVGLTQRLVVVSMDDDEGKAHRYKMVNPVITEKSAETTTVEEASITFLGVSALVTRPAEVTVSYLDENGAQQSVKARGLLATCLQHEIDYLDGKTILDYQQPMKRDVMKRKMEKQKRLGLIPHVHGPHCNHG
jgi:peptide deformylase